MLVEPVVARAVAAGAAEAGAAGTVGTAGVPGIAVEAAPSPTELIANNLI